jgi:Ca-activated chloride channel homolog
MFNPQAFENSRPDGIGVLEILDKLESQEQPRRFVPLKHSLLKGEVTGPLASLRLVQTFSFSAEQESRVIEAAYRFPLPGDAAVVAVWVRFGDVEIKTRLKERTQAERDYEEARQEGRQAALVTRESPDVFTLQIAGIQPGQKVVVETSYVQLARAEGPGWTLRLPLTTSPRYIRGDEVTSRHAQGQPLAVMRDPGHRFALDLAFRGAGAITSSTHRLENVSAGESKRVHLKEGEVLPDRDCVLSWQPAQEGRPALQVWLHDDHSSDRVYFLALIAPPATHDLGRGVPREVILLVDHSGSMEGAKWQAADWAVERFLSDLTEKDSFALGVFHNTTRWLAKKPQPANRSNVANAVAFLKANRDSGGTELGVALEQALALDRSKDSEVARHVLIITDAEVTDAGRILRLAEQETKQKQRRRISLLCIDAAPNALLATDLAEEGGGVARFLTSAPEEEDITTALDEVLADWSEPVLTGLRLEVNRPGAEATSSKLVIGADANHSAIDLGDLPAGRPIWVCGRVVRGQVPELTFHVRTGKQQDIANCRLDLQRQADPRPALKALFGAKRVRALEYLMHSGLLESELPEHLERLGYGQAELCRLHASKIYEENKRADLEAGVKTLLVREALEYGLASAETSFVATRTEPGKPVEETIVVANALPTGWSEGAIGGFATGAGSKGAALFCLADVGVPATRAAPQATGKMKRMANKLLHPLRSRQLDAFLDESAPAESKAGAVVLFTGMPQFVQGEAVLFDSTNGGDPLPLLDTIVEAEIRFPDGPPASIDANLCLLIFVEDAASPRARIRLADVQRHGGKRPLNLRRQPGQLLRLVLTDPSGAWQKSAPRLEVVLRHD